MSTHKVIDFNKATISRRVYQNTSLKKEPLFLNGEFYLLKYPERNKKITHEFHVSSYLNNTVSEYVGCHIFASIGIESQQTSVATRGGEIGVACKDFVDRDNGWELQEFGDLANRYFSSSDLGRVPTLETIYYVYENHETLKDISGLAKERFWESFIVDALIGNPDRHVGNWGFLVNQNTTKVKLAPIYDCGSSLYAKIDDLSIRKLLSSPKEIELLAHKFPSGQMKYLGANYDYESMILNPIHEDCQKALLSIYPKINMDIITAIILNTPTISPERIELLSVLTQERYNTILTPGYEKAHNEIEQKRIRSSNSLDERKVEAAHLAASVNRSVPSIVKQPER